jgi:hypothetical protein
MAGSVESLLTNKARQGQLFLGVPIYMKVTMSVNKDTAADTQPSSVAMRGCVAVGEGRCG